MRRIKRLVYLLRLIGTISSLSKASSFSIPRPSVPRKYAYVESGFRRRAALSSTTEEPALTEELFNGDTTLTKQVSRRSRLRNLVWRYSSLPRKPIKLYYNYVRQLWYETSTDARRRIAQDKAAEAIRAVEKLIKEDEYVEFSYETSVARERLLDACKAMLTEMKNAQEASKDEAAPTKDVAATTSDKAVKPERKRRSILFGATMGFCVACWVFSGNWIFTGIFTLMTILGQLEYYRMIINTGVYPARKISVVGASSMFLTVSRCKLFWSTLPTSPICPLTYTEITRILKLRQALFAPQLHQICLPMFGLWAMIWFLTMRRKVTSIPEIAATFTGMFYLGYVPSFWVRTRLFGMMKEPTRLAPLTGPMLQFLGKRAENLPGFIPNAVHLPITPGAIFIFWTWLCLAFADVGAYFVGRAYGKTKLGVIFPAAGATSPNKSVEGFLGGCVVSTLLAIAGAWVQKWPFWIVTGAIHGCMLALLGLIGDLTASMLKRDAGLKDFGDFIPEHGGIMDRVDSFIWTAPYSWLVCVHIIPALAKFAKATAASPV